MKGRGGFTLLELMVVIIILGVLIAIGVPRYIGAIEKARAKEALDTISAIKQGEIEYMLANASGLFVSINAAAPQSNFPGNSQLAIGWNTRFWNFQVQNATEGYCNIFANRRDTGGAATTTNIAFHMGNTNTMGWWTGNHPGTPIL